MLNYRVKNVFDPYKSQMNTNFSLDEKIDHFEHLSPYMKILILEEEAKNEYYKHEIRKRLMRKDNNGK